MEKRTFANPETVERPNCETMTNGSKARRVLVNYWRACAAWDMAYSVADGDGVTVAGYMEARRLYDACIRYGNAAARQWERANTFERYANSEQCTQDEKALDARRDRLQARLAGYGLKMVNYGLYPSLERINGHLRPVSLYF